MCSLFTRLKMKILKKNNAFKEKSQVVLGFLIWSEQVLVFAQQPGVFVRTGFFVILYLKCAFNK